MEMIVTGTTMALIDGIHNPPATRGDPPFPAEHAGRLALSIPTLGKTAAFDFKLDISDPDEISLSVRKTDNERGPFISILPLRGGAISGAIGFLFLFNELLDTLEAVWSGAEEGGSLYGKLPIAARWEVAHNALHLVLPIFEGTVIQ